MMYKNKSRICSGLTFLEMVIALAIMMIVFAAILPQFRAILNTWDSKQGSAEVLQNSRVLFDHLNRNITVAVRITDVSGSSVTNGFIEFEDNEGDTLRYDIAASNYVEFGPVGNLAELAGPVSQLQFTCYDDIDVDTPLVISTADLNDIRFVKVQTTLTNPAAMGQDETFTASTYLRTSWNPCTGSGLVGWWKLDETSGLTAADSSGNGNDGGLSNMLGDEWTTGQIGSALEFDGNNDYVDCGNHESLNITGDITIAAWVFVKSNDLDIVTKGSYNTAYSVWLAPAGNIRFALNDDRLTSTSTLSLDTWYHIAATREGNTRKIYIDGEEDASDTYGTAIETTTSSLTISTSSYSFDGIIDDVRIYNRALEPEEIAQLANILKYEEFTEAKAGSDTTSLTISTPGSTSEDDLLIAAVATDGDTDFSLSPPGGEGWTQINLNDYSSEVTLGAWWKNAGASESPSHQFTWSGDQQAYGWMMRFTGHDTSSPINDSMAGGELSSSPTSPAVTATVGSCIILRLGGFDDADITVGDPGLSGHTAITMDRSTAGATILGSWTSGLSHTAESGSNRLLVFTAHAEDDNANMNLSSVTYGGQAMTKVIDRNAGGGYRAYVVAYVLDEAGIAAASGSSFNVTWAQTPYQTPGYSSVFLGGVYQSSPIGDSASSTSSSSTVSTSALSTNVGDIVILAGTCGNTGSYAVGNGFTEGIELSIPSSDGVAGYKTATGASETPSITHSSVNRQGIIGFVAQSVSGGSGGAVSGGAGYMRQSAGGDSGASAFSLTASEQSRAITIAITPAQSSGDDGCEVQP